MARIVNNLLVGLVVVEAIVFLIPTNLLYFFGQGLMFYMILTRGVIVFTNDSPYLSFQIVVFVVFQILGYALFSLWRLIFGFKLILIKDIPKYIWLGIAIGAMAVTAFVVAIGYKSSSHLIASMLFGGGPLIFLITLLFCLAYREKYPCSHAIKLQSVRYLPWH